MSSPAEPMPDIVINMNLKKIQLHVHPEHMPAYHHLLNTDESFAAAMRKLNQLEASGEPMEVCLICGMPEEECICDIKGTRKLKIN